MEKAVKSNQSKVQDLVLLGLMTALVVVLELLGQFIHLGGQFAVTLVLVPIVVGSALLGPLAGCWLGFTFGMTVLLSGEASVFMGISIPGTIVTVLLKGMLAGLVSGVVYRLLEKKNAFLAVMAAAFLCPIVNTGIFLLGCFTFFFKALAAEATNAGKNLLAYLLVFYVGGNFIFELIFNLVLGPAIVRLIDVGKKTVLNRRR